MFYITKYVAGGNASATCLKMLVKRFADVQICASEFASAFCGAV